MFRALHNPCYEEPDRFNEFMTGTVLAGASRANHRQAPRGDPAILFQSAR
jgi:hypothetical protein